MRGLEIIFPWLASAAGVLALILLPWGWRGRRASDHPHCRRCGFDLFGLPPTSRRCSECGSDLDQRKAIRAGRRERHRGLVLTGMLLLLTCGGFWGYTATQRLRNLAAADKPTWWLLLDTKSKTPGYEQAAVAELIARYDRRVLSPKQTVEFLDRLLDIHGRPATTWPLDISSVIENARLGALLSDEKWDRFLRQTCQFTLVLRSEDRHFDGVPFRINVARVGWTRVGVSSLRITGLEVAGVACPDPLRSERRFARYLPLNLVEGGIIRIPQEMLSKSQSGSHAMKMWMEVKFSFAVADHKLEHRAVRIPVEAQLTFIPGRTQAPKLVAPPEHKTAMRSAVRIWSTGSVRHPQLTIETKSTPQPIAAQIWIRSDGRERFAGTFSNISGWWRSTTGICALTDFNSDCVDIILRPDPELVVETLDVTSIWGEEILFQHVQVRPLATTPSKGSNTKESSPQNTP